MCLLALIAEEPSYGYEMVDKLQRKGLELVSEGSIYPLLSRLQKRGYIEGHFVESTGGPPRKYYRIAGPGQRQLDEWTVEWRKLCTRSRGSLDGRRAWRVTRTPMRSSPSAMPIGWRPGCHPTCVRPSRATLRAKLDEAARRGRSPRRVTGSNLVLFAESMASRHRVPPPSHPPLSPSERTRQRWIDFVPAYGWLVPIIGGAVLLMIFGPKEDAVEDPDFWRWLWLGIAVVLGVGEMVTAGFFMLPFAIGAAIATLLAWADVSITVQLVVFISTSLIAVGRAPQVCLE